ncbi:DUF2254 domain-containing protein [Alkalihalobacillus sp. MEB130]|uniref:DUF2254 domain-containing protein n=1 Tax=Alkalihalobacillus sp. MEB130 TaxID=2976704 RepID=UPI0028E03BAF|nr:DUF2254 domain-containing protein [Alkalihalobacillus sp. MEB130]MDT8862580.1 DUF2254 domain-containing protein [Alkalihalobacillus sp. MEB130]
MFYNLTLKVKKNIWFIPSAYCLVASLLAFAVIWLDTIHGKKIEAMVPATLLISVELAQTILGILAAALLTMITITFSTIMVVLTTYSTQFSPRTLSDFVTNKVTMRVLGVYMGGFMYSILSLLFMREDLEHEVMAGTLGVLLSIVCLAFFAYFIHHVATSIQVNKLIFGVTHHTLQAFRERLKPNVKNEVIVLANDKPKIELGAYKVEQVRSKSFGYIQLIQVDDLFKLAKKHNFVIEIVPTMGSFLTTNKVMFKIYYEKDMPTINMHKFIEFGTNRTILQDVDFGIQKIVEVVVRALSPGMNDPNTAIDGILHLGKLLATACKQNGSYVLYLDDGEVRVFAPKKTVEELLYTTFYQICHYGRDDISIILATYDALIMVAEENDESIKKKIWSFSRYLYKSFNTDTCQELDLHYLHEKIAALREVTEGAKN